MTCHKPVVLTCFLSISGLIYPQATHADGFTGRMFQTWSLDQQDAYIETSMSMASALAGQSAPAFGDCLDDWYFGTDGVQDGRNDVIRDVIGKYQDHHPSAVIVGALINICGHPN